MLETIELRVLKIVASGNRSVAYMTNELDTSRFTIHRVLSRLLSAGYVTSTIGRRASWTITDEGSAALADLRDSLTGKELAQ